MSIFMKPAKQVAAAPDQSRTLPRRAALTAAVPAPAAAAAYSSNRSMTAAASVLTGNRSRTAAAAASASASAVWQHQAWDYYDQIGEIKFAFSMVANLLSRIRLYPALIDDPTKAPKPLSFDDSAELDNGSLKAISAFKRLDNSTGGKPQLLRNMTLNMLVAGECYLVQTPATTNAQEDWAIRSVSEVRVTGSGISVKDSAAAGQFTPLPDKAYCARTWRSHPQYSSDADSSMLGLLDLCAELLLLNSTYRATARSRLNAGALYLPDGLSISQNENPVPAGPTDGTTPTTGGMLDPHELLTDDEDADEFENNLIEAMSSPITDEASVTSIVPIIIRGPEQLGEKIRLIKFERSFDPALTERADRVLDRIMQGIDVPKDIVQGLANVRYSNAVTIDENLYKAHIEPLALLICDALTAVFLRPVMQSSGISAEEARKFCIWYDPSQITTKPNRSEDADKGYEKKVLSGATWRATHGFSDADAPEANELVIRMLSDNGSITPELTEALLAVIAPGMMEHVRSATQANMPAPLDPAIANALGVAPTAGTPPVEDEDADETPQPSPDTEPQPTPSDDQPVEVIDPARLL